MSNFPGNLWLAFVTLLRSVVLSGALRHRWQLRSTAPPTVRGTHYTSRDNVGKIYQKSFYLFALHP